jgi:hypothetical protein
MKRGASTATPPLPPPPLGEGAQSGTVSAKIPGRKTSDSARGSDASAFATGTNSWCRQGVRDVTRQAKVASARNKVSRRSS